MDIDIPNTLSLWQLLVSAAIFIFTALAFMFAYVQWRKDNFLKTATEILQAEREYLRQIADAAQRNATEQEVLGIATDFLNKMDLFSVYFIHGMIHKSMVLKYFGPFFLKYWENEFLNIAITSISEKDPSAFNHLKTFINYLEKPKRR